MLSLSERERKETGQRESGLQLSHQKNCPHCSHLLNGQMIHIHLLISAQHRPIGTHVPRAQHCWDGDALIFVQQRSCDEPAPSKSIAGRFAAPPEFLMFGGSPMSLDSYGCVSLDILWKCDCCLGKVAIDLAGRQTTLRIIGYFQLLTMQLADFDPLFGQSMQQHK